MLPESVFVFQPSTVFNGDQYTIDLFFQDPAKPAFLNLGDHVKDTAGNEYALILPTVIPFTDGNTVTVQAVTTNVQPFEDADFDSTAFTPGQVDLRPAMRTSGSLGTPSLFSGPNYEYSVLAGWNDPAQEALAIVGDRIVDFSGKEYQITFIDGTSRFAVPIRVTEVERVGILPTAGDASMYRPTGNFSFFQGTEMGDPARNTILARDAKLIDLNLHSGSTAASFLKEMENLSGASIATGTPVSKKTDGSIVAADSDGVGAQTYIGIAAETILNGATGNVSLPGPNFVGAVSGLGFTPGDDVFISETGGFTNDPNSFTGGDDTIQKIGIADCSAGTASTTANDILSVPEILVTP